MFWGMKRGMKVGLKLNVNFFDIYFTLKSCYEIVRAVYDYRAEIKILIFAFLEV